MRVLLALTLILALPSTSCASVIIKNGPQCSFVSTLFKNDECAITSTLFDDLAEGGDPASVSDPNTEDKDTEPRFCTRATADELAPVNAGNLKREKFLTLCRQETKGFNSARLCEALITPSRKGVKAFQCAYGPEQPFMLLHPDESTWGYGISAVRLVQQLEAAGVCVLEIYNWWRPEPYNKMSWGAARRHPLGAAVDVRLCSKEDQDRAHALMCSARAAGKLRALGYYPKPALHLGVGDERANTWGKDCPK